MVGGRKPVESVFGCLGWGGDLDPSARVVRDTKGKAYALVRYSTHYGTNSTYVVLAVLKVGGHQLWLRNRAVLSQFLAPAVTVHYDYHLERPKEGGLIIVLHHRSIKKIDGGGWPYRVPPRAKIVRIKPG